MKKRKTLAVTAIAWSAVLLGAVPAQAELRSHQSSHQRSSTVVSEHQHVTVRNVSVAHHNRTDGRTISYTRSRVLVHGGMATRAKVNGLQIVLRLLARDRLD